MDHASGRPLGAKAKVCGLGVSLLLLLSRTALAEPVELDAVDGELGVVVYPAQSPGPRRVTVLLHGMCGEPRNTCSHFALQVTESEHLVCPRASQRCEGGGASWPERGFEQQIEHAATRAEQLLGERVDASAGRTLIGYSLGAFRALELAQHGAGKYPRVMLLGARIHPDARRLRESGVERLLLGAGAYDMTYVHMQREAERVARRGLSARFLGLGPVGHAFTASFASYLPEALGWLESS
jgi:predicted esterase